MHRGTEQTTPGDMPAPVQPPTARLPSPYPSRGGGTILRKERIHLKKELSPWCSGQEEISCPNSVSTESKLVTLDTLSVEASAGFGNFGFSVREIKMWALSAKSLTGMLPSQRGRSAGKTPRFVQGAGKDVSCQGSPDLLRCFSALGMCGDCAPWVSHHSPGS